MNLADLHARTDWVRRRAIEFPAFGIVVLKNNGDAAESYAGSLSALNKPNQPAGFSNAAKLGVID